MTENYTYTENDLVVQDLESAPNLDLPAFEIEKFAIPRDNSPLRHSLTSAFEALFL